MWNFVDPYTTAILSIIPIPDDRQCVERKSLTTAGNYILQVLFLAAFPGSYLLVFAKNIRSRSREFRRLETNPPRIELNPTETENSDDDQ